jgi:hypothetical protein
MIRIGRCCSTARAARPAGRPLRSLRLAPPPKKTGGGWGRAGSKTLRRVRRRPPPGLHHRPTSPETAGGGGVVAGSGRTNQIGLRPRGPSPARSGSHPLPQAGEGINVAQELGSLRSVPSDRHAPGRTRSLPKRDRILPLSRAAGEGAGGRGPRRTQFNARRRATIRRPPAPSGSWAAAGPVWGCRVHPLPIPGWILRPCDHLCLRPGLRGRASE